MLATHPTPWFGVYPSWVQNYPRTNRIRLSGLNVIIFERRSKAWMLAYYQFG
jgi:hypothetical protein